MQLINLKETDSTNKYLLDNAAMYADEPLTIAIADYQTAGRGMGTNTWESEPGKNLLFSMLIHPDWLPIREQFLLSMAEALALRQAIEEEMQSEDVTIKWPNDIYYKDRKISGTRIDLNIMSGKMQDFVLGTGINVNQKTFHSDAPNPVSMYQITGKEHSVKHLLNRIVELFNSYFETLLSLNGKEVIVEQYHKHLYRRHGEHTYEDVNGVFKAELSRVKSNGIMVLRRSDGTLSEYEFKEVKFVLD